MHSIDGAYCDRCRTCLCVCLLVTFVSHAKTAEPIEIPFGRLTLVGPLLDGNQDLSTVRAIFGGCPAHCKALRVSAVVYAAKGIIPSLITACSDRDKSILNNGTMFDAAFCQNSLAARY